MAMSVRPPPQKKPKTEPSSTSVAPPPTPPLAFASTPGRPPIQQRPPPGQQQQQQQVNGQQQVRPPFQLGRPPPPVGVRPQMMGTPQQQQQQNGMANGGGARLGQQQGTFTPQQNGNAQAGPSNQASMAYNTGSPAPISRPSTPAGQGGNAGGGSGEVRHGSLDDLTDGIIDYKAEEDALQRHAQPTFRARPNIVANANAKKQSFLDPVLLRRKMSDVAFREYGLSIPDESLTYLSLACETRVRDLLTSMIRAKNHRLTSTHAHAPPLHADGKTPLWDETITSEPAKWLSTLERVEKEEEGKKRRERNARDEEERRRKEMGDEYDGPLGGNGDVNMEGGMGTPGGEDGEGGKKKKKMGPGVSARNMSETAQKRMSNSAALHSAGLKKKSWMFASGGATGGAMASPSPASRTLKASSPLGGGSPPPDAGSSSSSLSKPTFGSSSTIPANPSSLSQSSTTFGGNASNSTPTQSSWSRPFLSSTTSTPLAPPVHAASVPSNLRHPRSSSGAEVYSGGGPVELGAVSMRDALFVLGKERGHGAGKGSSTKLVGRALGKRNDRGWE
ncbi:hypothetical protein BDY24DRAFT_386471 [Mrakia frigida]|uniref:uncharacterized protein n=1 Tax=Mrakia frigida TaxID=29902 RepID=UPI003FCC24AA